MRIESDLEDDYEYLDEESIPDSNYIVMFCCEGLECVIPLDMSKLNDGAEMLAILEDRENQYSKEMNRLLFMLTMRARANSQRNYEIFKLTCSGGITKENLESMFEQNPQSAADLVRAKGVRLYGEKLSKRTQVII
jgi:hypothetical protein